MLYWFNPFFMATLSHVSELQVLFSTYFDKVFDLYFKTHSAHWNVKGGEFYSLHKLLDEQYTGLWESLDEIAEHLRALSVSAPVQVKPVNAVDFDSSCEIFLTTLAQEQENLIDWLRSAIRQADSLGDISGADFLTERLAEHEKMAWMLKASL